jgi:hypothetical protein
LALARALPDSYRVLGVFLIDVDADLGAEDGELLYGRRALEVAGREEDSPALVLEHEGQLGGARRLARALEAEEEDDALGIRPPQLEVLPRIAEEADHAVVDDLGELLARADGLEDLLALGLLEGRVDEAPHDAKVYVGVEEGELDLLDRVLDVLLGDGRLAAQGPCYIAELLADLLEHGTRLCPPRRLKVNRRRGCALQVSLQPYLGGDGSESEDGLADELL